MDEREILDHRATLVLDVIGIVKRFGATTALAAAAYFTGPSPSPSHPTNSLMARSAQRSRAKLTESETDDVDNALSKR